MLINLGLAKLQAYLNSLYKILLRCLEEQFTPTNPEGGGGVGIVGCSGKFEDYLSNPQLNIQPTSLSQKTTWVYPEPDTETIM